MTLQIPLNWIVILNFNNRKVLERDSKRASWTAFFIVVTPQNYTLFKMNLLLVFYWLTVVVNSFVQMHGACCVLCCMNCDCQSNALKGKRTKLILFVLLAEKKENSIADKYGF